MSKRPALGKGLGALLQNSETDITIGSTPEDVGNIVGAVSSIKISDIEANPFQPRTQFEKDALVELSDSIRELGIIQPVTVRKLGYGKYQLISGERRFRASQIVGLKEVPAFIRIANDQEMLEMALVENIQRQDLDAIEVAFSYQKLIEECNLTQEELSSRIGKNRSTISNYLRILQLPDEIQAGIRDQLISMGHARALLSFKDPAEIIKAYQEIIKNHLSVRATENLGKRKKSNNNIPLTLSRYEKRMQDELSHQFQTKIKIDKSNKGKGKIVINFDNEIEMNRIIDLLEK